MNERMFAVYNFISVQTHLAVSFLACFGILCLKSMRHHIYFFSFELKGTLLPQSWLQHNVEIKCQVQCFSVTRRLQECLICSHFFECRNDKSKYICMYIQVRTYIHTCI